MANPWESKKKDGVPKWGGTEAQKALDRELDEIAIRFQRIGFVRPKNFDDMLKRLKDRGDEAEIRKLVEEGKRAIVVTEKAHEVGGSELVRIISELDTIKADTVGSQLKGLAQQRGNEKLVSTIINRYRRIKDLRTKLSTFPDQDADPIRQDLNAINVVESSYETQLPDIERRVSLLSSKLEKTRTAEAITQRANQAEANKETEENDRRSREVQVLQSRINALAPQQAGPLNQKLSAIPISGKARDFKKAIHDIEIEITKAEK